MTMPRFTAAVSLDTDRAQYNTTAARSLADGAAVRPQLPDQCAGDLAQLRRHYRDLVAAVSRRDWEMVYTVSNWIRYEQQEIETSCR
jgi:hypothetical protein